MKNIKIIVRNLLCILSILIIPACQTEDKTKDFILKNSDRIYLTQYGIFEIDSVSSYYTDLTIKILSDSSYSVILWGDRQSFFWRWEKDYSFCVDIPYNRYKGKEVANDIKIIEAIKHKTK
jgi:hypothetical protein